MVDALAGLDGTEVPPKGWGTEGCALGAEAMVEWSTLDAQWFGVAQRRRRVFALADFGNWRDRPPILLEPEGMRGDSAPRRQAGQGVAGGSTVSTGSRSVAGALTTCYGKQPDSSDTALGPNLVIEQRVRRPVLSSSGDVSHCLNAGGMGRIDYETETMVVTASAVCPTLRAGGNRTGGDRPPGTDVDTCDSLVISGHAVIAFNSNAQPDEMRFDPHLSAPLTCSQNSAVLAYGVRTGQTGANGIGVAEELAHTLDLANAQAVALFIHANKGRPNGRQSAHTAMVGVKPLVETLTTDGHAQSAVFVPPMQVRRLTPLECERLQAFPDGFTAVPTNGKPAADGPRYKALGNSMCVNVMRWIGHQVDSAVRFW